MGGSAAIVLYILNILGAAAMVFILPDLIVDMTLQSINVPYGFQVNRSAVESVVMGTLVFTFLVALVMGIIIIGYVNSKKDLFVN